MTSCIGPALTIPGVATEIVADDSAGRLADKVAGRRYRDVGRVMSAAGPRGRLDVCPEGILSDEPASADGCFVVVDEHERHRRDCARGRT